ncbi:hypothetical protein GGI25_000770 [Coemansia spiralis]|uniref:Guanylyl cyclase n=2 Tax=Coemansia TaxID=4863 RepID=A0A9W8GEF3_9FUNG|nr:hypothetical protein EDC05_005862 [Coemansia umbellata]KAJ2621940.1 hypothetical protein GGI26_003644 [Coemansia sp. RSA 1358]KAJ2680478.1 hypothetical protein GGI25_000770 [Coemansia spiralis]
MSSVLERLQALVTTVISQPTLSSEQQQQQQQQASTLTSSPEIDEVKDSVSALGYTAPDSAPVATTFVVSHNTNDPPVSSVKLLYGDTLRPSSVREQRRKRRQTDATISSVSTTVSADSVSVAMSTAATAASPLPSSKQEMERLLSYRMGDLERLSRLHPVSKVLQQESWDCGLACVCMILRAFGQATCTVAKLERQAQTSSIWTIDLAFLLHRNLPHADFTYYTACVGVNPEHTKNSFYSGLLDEDEQRVMQLFSRARAEMSVRIVEIAIPLLDLKRFLVHRQYVAVLLVDSAALKCIACERSPRALSSATSSATSRAGGHGRSKSINVFRFSKPANNAPSAAANDSGAGSRSGVLSWFSRRRWAKDGYLGHYILLFAFIPSLDVFLYRNPAIPEEFCLASAATINAARTRSGTDADCIILKL